MTPNLTLYTYYRSSCSARVRIALHLKNIPFESVPIHLLKADQKSDAYLALNPSASVPTLIVEENGHKTVITQSVSILEYIEEKFPQKALLPSVPSERATVRDLVNIIVIDTQPFSNLRTQQKLKGLGLDIDVTTWCKDFNVAGLGAFENRIKSSAGKFSVGDDITLADVVLVPAIESALRLNQNIEDYPTVYAIWKRLEAVEAFQKGHWSNQDDTPEEFKSKNS